MICTAADAVGYEIGLPCTKTMPAPAICTAADAVGYEIGLSCGESRRDIVFYAAAKGCPHKTYFVARIAIPGNVFPSRNSREAPPPVDT